MVGMSAEDALNLSKSYVKKTLQGAGALKGEKGDPGRDGADGADGKSAYQIWLDEGNTGTEKDFLNSLEGEDGEPGQDGQPGEPGADGQPGADGKSAYDTWLEHGNIGSEQDFLDSLQGKSIKSISKDENNNVIVTFSDDSIQNIGRLDIDIQSDFLTEEGFGNLRFVDNKFQYYDKSSLSWVDTNVTPDNNYILSLTPQPMQTFIAQCNPDTMNIELIIKESSDTIVDKQVFVIVEKVIIRRKKDEFPIDENDGDLVIEINRKNFGTYKNNPYIDIVDGLTSGDTYCYKAFPISNLGIVNNSVYNESKCTIKDYWLFGFTLDQNESNPASMISYIEDNENYESAYMDYDADSFNYGSWSKAWFVRDIKPCMLNYDGTVAYELDKDNYNLKVDGTASDIESDSFSGNAMVGIPKVYWKIVDNGDNTANIYFCNKKIDDDFVCWSHLDNNGNEINYCYMPIYNGYSDGTRLRSLSKKTVINAKSVSAEINLAKANNLDNNIIWYTEVFSDRMLINLLLLLIGKNTDTQTIFGNGRYTTNTNAENLSLTGTLNGNGLFYGSKNTNIGVKVFGMEHYWAHQYRKIAGCICNKGTQMIKMTYGQSDGSTVDGYNTDGTGYINIGCKPSGTNSTSGNESISKMSFTKYGLIPVVAKGSTTTYYADSLSFDNSVIGYLNVGGRNDESCGTFTYVLNSLASTTSAMRGTAISCKPLGNIE